MESTDISVRTVNKNDEHKIIEMNDGVFESMEEIRDYIRNKKIYVFEKESKMVGAGLLSRIILRRPEFDLGVIVDKKNRKRGYGTFIIQYLAALCMKNGWVPVAGCDSRNIASRRCLEKAGFKPLHRLLLFRFS